MKTHGIVLGTLRILLTTGLVTGTAFAASHNMESNADMGDKIKRGALNTTTGWTELPMQVVEESSSQNPYHGMTYGFINGLSTGLKRTLYGAWDFVTFPVPEYDKPVMEPETVFDKT